ILQPFVKCRLSGRQLAHRHPQGAAPKIGSAVKIAGLTIDDESTQFAFVHRLLQIAAFNRTDAHEIFAYYGTRDGYRAIPAFLSRRARINRVIAPRLSPRSLYAGVFGGARRRSRAGRTYAQLGFRTLF